MLGFNGGRIGVTNTSDDPNYSNVSLLLNGNGTNGSTTFTDSSIYGHTVTANGNAQISTAQSKFGGSSLYFDGNGDYLTCPTSTDFNMESSDFTVECWIRWDGTSTPYQNFVGSNSVSFTGNATFFRVWGSGSGVLSAKVGIGNPTHDGVNSVYSVTSLAPNIWTHVAAARSSGIIKLYINGILDKTGSFDTSTYDFGDNGLCVGAAPWDGPNGYFAGYIDDLRITKGVARYTANFTPPTAPFPDGETGTFASGVWTALEQCDAVRRGIWPSAPI